MNWVKTLVVGGWLCIFTAFYAEQYLSPLILTDLNQPDLSGGPLSILTQADPFSDFFLMPNGQSQIVPVPVIREPFLKWKSIQPEHFLDPGSPTHSNPEYFQDIWRCPTVAVVLFPYHEFL